MVFLFNTHINFVLMFVSLLMNFAVDWPTPKIPCKMKHNYYDTRYLFLDTKYW